MQLSDKPAKHPVKIACALLLALAPSSGALAQEDPLKSAACGAALAQLQQARAAGAEAASIESARSAASGACLGTSTLPTRPSRVLQAPVVVPPPQIEVPQHVAPLPAPTLPAPPIAVQRPPMPALCDAAGCWANDGSHLRYVPPTIIGPPGGCIPQGPQVLCP